MAGALLRRAVLLAAAATACSPIVAPTDAPGPEGACGDGVVQAGEACDGGAFCSSSCTLAVCGDGFVDEGEACDPAAGAGPCSAECQLPRCGDGRLEAGEACDAGGSNGVAGSGCTQRCTIDLCGDGAVDPTEQCDDGPRNDDHLGACRQDCTFARCGDGLLGPGESCDGGETCGPDCRPIGCRASAIAVGWWTSYVLLGDGRVYGFGSADAGSLPTTEILEPGCVARGTCSPSPVLLSLPPLAAISTGLGGGAGLLADGTGVVTWGLDDRGQRGDGAPFESSPTSSLLPREAFGGAALRGISRGRDELVVITEAGELWGTGGNGTGSLLFAADPAGAPCPSRANLSATADDSPDCLASPVRFHPDESRTGRPFRRLALGRGHVVAIDERGDVLAWGNNAQGQLGADLLGSPSCGGNASRAPNAQTEVLATESVAVAAAAWSSYWLDGERVLWGVGAACDGELGVPGAESTWIAQRIELVEDGQRAGRLLTIAGSAAAPAAAAIDEDGAIWTFGRSQYGALGLVGLEADSFAIRPHRVTIPSPSRPVELAIGRSHLLVRLEDGEVWALGLDSSGQRGQGTSDELPHPEPVRVRLPCEP